MAKVVINDLLFEFREENNRLLNDLLFSQKCVHFLEKYRKCLISFNNNCICDQNIIIKSKLNDLEMKYKTLNERIERKYGLNEYLFYGKQCVNKDIIEDIERNDKTLTDNSIPVLNDWIGCEVEINESNDLKTIETNSFNQNYLCEESNQRSDNKETNVRPKRSRVKPKRYEFNDSVVQQMDESEEEMNGLNVKIEENDTNCDESEDFVVSDDDYRQTDSDFSETDFKPKSKHKGNIQNLRNHKPINEKRNKRRKPYTCGDCGLSFYKKETLESHMNRHNNVKPYECQTCGNRFLNSVNLNKHMIYQHKEREFKCKYIDCEYETNNIQLFKRHYIKHKNIRKFKCNETNCQKSYFTKTDLIQHKAVHIDVKAYECCWPGCEARFKTKINLFIHNKIHINDRKYKCNFSDCNQTFITSSALTRHKLTHQTAKPYLFVCDWPECRESFKNKNGLTIHQNRHENKNYYKCHFDGCDKTYFRSNHMNRHFREAHKQ